MKNYLEYSEIIDYLHPDIQTLARELALNCNSDVEIAKNCFEYVRDEIRHSGDYKENITTCIASDVLKHKTGWCYAKSHLLAALLRANNIPTAFCYQRLSCSEYQEDIYCLHGLNAIYFKQYGWYRVDARGNKKGVNAQFIPPKEQLAFELKEHETDLQKLYCKPLKSVIKALQEHTTYDEMVNHLPDIQQYIRKARKDDAAHLSRLVHQLNHFIFNEHAPQWFLDTITKEAFEARILSCEYQHFVYIIENKMVGFIALHNQTKLYHLFVDVKFQGQKIAKKLWEFVKDELVIETMEVNSSVYAIKVYESFGFVKEDEIKNHMGMDYLPMKYRGNGIYEKK